MLERFEWLARYWSDSSSFNQQLLEEAARQFPGCDDGPIPSFDCAGEEEDLDEWAFGTPSWAA